MGRPFAAILIALLALISLPFKILQLGNDGDGLRNSAPGRRAMGRRKRGVYGVLAVSSILIVRHWFTNLLAACAVWPILQRKSSRGATRPLRRLSLPACRHGDGSLFGPAGRRQPPRPGQILLGDRCTIQAGSSASTTTGT
jgi:hypothetical protein